MIVSGWELKVKNAGGPIFNGCDVVRYCFFFKTKYLLFFGCSRLKWKVYIKKKKAVVLPGILFRDSFETLMKKIYIVDKKLLWWWTACLILVSSQEIKAFKVFLRSQLFYTDNLVMFLWTFQVCRTRVMVSVQGNRLLMWQNGES